MISIAASTPTTSSPANASPDGGAIDYARARAVPSICFGCTTHCGVIGWVHRTEQMIAPEVLEAAFTLPLREVSQPIRLKTGVALVVVLGAEETPEEEAFRDLVRRGRHQELRAEFLAGLDLTTVYDEEG